MLAEIATPRSSAAATAATRAIAAASCGNNNAFKRATQRREGLRLAAAAAAPGAIAATTARTERNLISRIFAEIPTVLALSQAHSEADAFDADTVDEKHELWNDARCEVERLAQQVVSLPPESAADAHRRVMLYRQVLAYTEGAPLDGSDDEVFAEDRQVMGDGAIAALAALARQASPDGGPWASARAAYEAALAESEAANIRARDAAEELARTMPIPEVLQLGPGRWYFLEEHIERDVRDPWPGNERLSAEDAAEKLAVLREFKPRYDAESRRLQLDELEKAYDSALSRQGNLAVELINTPAPTMEAALQKLEVLLREFHGADTPEAVSGLLAGTDPDPWAATRVLQDLLRLTGSASPLLSLNPFSPAQWERAFRAAGGSIRLDRGTATIVTPFHTESAKEAQRLVAVLDEGDNRAALLAWLKEVS